jgi:hypothetical protein
VQLWQNRKTRLQNGCATVAQPYSGLFCICAIAAQPQNKAATYLCNHGTSTKQGCNASVPPLHRHKTGCGMVVPPLHNHFAAMFYDFAIIAQPDLKIKKQDPGKVPSWQKMEDDCAVWAKFDFHSGFRK